MNKDINKKIPINQKEKNEIFSDFKNKKDDLSEILKKWVDKGKIKVELAGTEFELETASYDFEYPERIQKETGILWYKRTIIEYKDIIKTIIECGKPFGFDKRIGNCIDLGSLVRECYQISRAVANEKGTMTRYSGIDYNNKYYETQEGLFYQFIDHIDSKIIKKLDISLSNGEFPSRTFNHTIGAHMENEKMFKIFKEDKMFLQKLFDVNLTEKIKLGRRQIAVDETTEIKIDVYDKKSDKLIYETNTYDLYKTKNEIKKNEVYLIGYDTLNTEVAHFWGSYFVNPSFGFTINDPFFKKYIKKVYEFLLINNYDTKKEIIGIAEILKILAFCDDDFYENYKKYFKMISNIYKKYDYFWEKNITEEEKINMEEEKNRLNHMFNEIVKKFLPNINLGEIILNKEKIFSSYEHVLLHGMDKKFNFNELFVKAISNIFGTFLILPNSHETTFEKFLRESIRPDSFYSNKESEIYIPIFINHDEIPQLSWGHAKYAHFLNKKWFNFFEFKHADHLPSKE